MDFKIEISLRKIFAITLILDGILKIFLKELDLAVLYMGLGILFLEKK